MPSSPAPKPNTHLKRRSNSHSSSNGKPTTLSHLSKHKRQHKNSASTSSSSLLSSASTVVSDSSHDVNLKIGEREREKERDKERVRRKGGKKRVVVVVGKKAEGKGGGGGKEKQVQCPIKVLTRWVQGFGVGNKDGEENGKGNGCPLWRIQLWHVLPLVLLAILGLLVVVVALVGVVVVRVLKGVKDGGVEGVRWWVGIEALGMEGRGKGEVGVDSVGDGGGLGGVDC